MMANRWRNLLSLAGLLLAVHGPQALAACTAGPPLVGVAEQTPSQEFIALANGTVLHSRTRLIWKRCAEGQSWSGSTCSGAAQTFAWEAALSHADATTDAGSSDWRLPNRKELESLIEFCGHSPTINQESFPATPAERFWSSTTFADDALRAWDVYFSDGYVEATFKTDAHHVRLVRNVTESDYPLPQTITFGAAPNLLLGGSGTLTATASSGLPVVLGVATPGFCSLSGTTLTMTAIGVCTVTANQAGRTPDWAAAPEARQDIGIGKLDQTITFGAIPVLVVGGTGTLTATATSGLPVALSSTTPSVCALNGATLTGVAVGTCIITANQAGNASYTPAPQASRNIAVSSASSGSGTPPPDLVPQVVLSLVPGWNLVGNGTDAPLDVDTLFGDNTKVEAVWRWVPTGVTAGVKYPVWAFRTPALGDKGAGWAKGRGYEALTTIQPGQGFWVKARIGFAVILPGTPLPATALAPASTGQSGVFPLGTGWSLVATGQELTPAQFNAAIGGPHSGLVSLWAWDAATGRWLFYSPTLEAQGETALADYATRRGMLDFTSSGRRLLPGAGFWINRR